MASLAAHQLSQFVWNRYVLLIFFDLSFSSVFLGFFLFLCLFLSCSFFLLRLPLSPLHTFSSDSFLLKGEPPPECIPCNCPLTIKHLLIECVDFSDVRQRFYRVPSLQDLLKTVKPEVILEFLKASALYRPL